MTSKRDRQLHALEVVKRLDALYPDAKCSLDFRSPLELLVATILSAQCTDDRVNIVTKDLFKTYRTAQDYAGADLNELESAIKSTGFFRNKARNIQACCIRLVESFGGQVPRTIDDLVTLPGVGRKTANVVLGTAFGIASGVVVDTHVTRVSQRLGLTKSADAVKIESDLMAQLPKSAWVDFSHAVIQHGRRVCKARKPLCEACGLADICPKIGVSTAKPKAARRAPARAKLATRRAVER